MIQKTTVTKTICKKYLNYGQNSNHLNVNKRKISEQKNWIRNIFFSVKKVSYSYMIHNELNGRKKFQYQMCVWVVVCTFTPGILHSKKFLKPLILAFDVNNAFSSQNGLFSTCVIRNEWIYLYLTFQHLDFYHQWPLSRPYTKICAEPNFSFDAQHCNRQRSHTLSIF